MNILNTRIIQYPLYETFVVNKFRATWHYAWVQDPWDRPPKLYTFNLYSILNDTQENIMTEKHGGNLVYLHSK